ncbi:MAG TPA: hypothetical protein VGE12_10300 [Noviherbaspirillum sp.]
MTPEGNIGIRLAWDGKQISRVQISPRPLVQVNALLRGKSPQEALRIIPMIFSLCGQAQAAAAATALDAAASGDMPVVPLTRERRVLAEALQEILWRFLLDLPRILHAPPQSQQLALLRRQLAGCLSAADEAQWQQGIAGLASATGHALFGTAAGWTACKDAANLIRMLEASDTATARLLVACWKNDTPPAGKPVALMPFAQAGHVMDTLLPSLAAEPRFSAYPTWQGHAMETGSLARMQHCPPMAGLLTNRAPSTGLRLLARLLDIDDLLSRLRAPALPEDSFVQGAPFGPGAGIAWVQNARGLLLHRAVLDKQGAIADYCVVAPTEWNFHPAGPCAQELTCKPASTRAQAHQHAELAAHSLDPCVAYQIEVDHA